MEFVRQWWVESLGFMDAGGQVMWFILATTLAMWTIIIERFFYLRVGHRARVRSVTTLWNQRAERSSWWAHQQRRSLISQVTVDLARGVGVVKALIQVCPLLGLLGTVTGMLTVFDAMAAAGSGNPRALASGISEAVLTTMAGLVAGISGLPFAVVLEGRVKSERALLGDLLLVEHERCTERSPSTEAHGETPDELDRRTSNVPLGA